LKKDGNENVEVKMVTNDFLDYFLPSIDKITYVNPKVPWGNNTIYYNLIIYGNPGCGKTTVANSIAHMAIDKYGADNVNCVFAEDGNLGQLQSSGLEDKLINIMFADNVTMVIHDRETLTKFFRMRNIYHDTYGRSNGYILSILALHRYHGIPIELRSNVDGIIIRDTSLNPYDKTVLKHFMDNELLEKLMIELATKRFTNTELMNYSVFIGKTVKGLVSIPPRETFVFKRSINFLDKLWKDMLIEGEFNHLVRQ
jgi:hypothetical protein